MKSNHAALNSRHNYNHGTHDHNHGDHDDNHAYNDTIIMASRTATDPDVKLQLILTCDCNRS